MGLALTPSAAVGEDGSAISVAKLFPLQMLRNPRPLLSGTTSARFTFYLIVVLMSQLP